jgi:exodeoxyribonuclease III
MSKKRMEIISWNVNGIRAWDKKGLYNQFILANPDILCLQETKAHPEQLTSYLQKPEGYFAYFNSAQTRRGYSGVSIYTKTEPRQVLYGLGVEHLDQEGRQLTLIFDDFILINCYFPNGGGQDHRLEYKLAYFDAFTAFLKKLEKTNKNIIFCGDINIAHTEMDIARPKENAKSIGFLPQERAKIDTFIKNEYVDIFRDRNPETIKYTWWDQKSRARERNVGWRIDYFFVHKSFLPSVDNLFIRDTVQGSDHCPIACTIRL